MERTSLLVMGLAPMHLCKSLFKRHILVCMVCFSFSSFTFSVETHSYDNVFNRSN